jgi:hypothetical protein
VKNVTFWLFGILAVLLGGYYVYNNTQVGTNLAASGIGPGVVGAGGSSGVSTGINDLVDQLDSTAGLLQQGTAGGDSGN